MDDLIQSWAEIPPIGMCVRGYMGYSSDRAEKSSSKKREPVVISERQYAAMLSEIEATAQAAAKIGRS